jgi:hypothetical protein
VYAISVGVRGERGAHRRHRTVRRVRIGWAMSSPEFQRSAWSVFAMLI